MEATLEFIELKIESIQSAIKEIKQDLALYISVLIYLSGMVFYTIDFKVLLAPELSFHTLLAANYLYLVIYFSDRVISKARKLKLLNNKLDCYLRAKERHQQTTSSGNSDGTSHPSGPSKTGSSKTPSYSYHPGPVAYRRPKHRKEDWFKIIPCTKPMGRTSRLYKYRKYYRLFIKHNQP